MKTLGSTNIHMHKYPNTHTRTHTRKKTLSSSNIHMHIYPTTHTHTHARKKQNSHTHTRTHTTHKAPPTVLLLVSSMSFVLVVILPIFFSTCPCRFSMSKYKRSPWTQKGKVKSNRVKSNRVKSNRVKSNRGEGGQHAWEAKHTHLNMHLTTRTQECALDLFCKHWLSHGRHQGLLVCLWSWQPGSNSCVCVCVCVCVCMCLYVSVCVCMWVSQHQGLYHSVCMHDCACSVYMCEQVHALLSLIPATQCHAYRSPKGCGFCPSARAYSWVGFQGCLHWWAAEPARPDQFQCTLELQCTSE